MSAATCTIFVERFADLENQWLSEVPVTIEYEFTCAEAPSADRCYPGCPADVEILNTSLVLTVDETVRALDACWKDVKRRQKEAFEP